MLFKNTDIPRSTRPGSAERQQGFILITSLLFLVIITLLALSGINSSALQQRMATNSNDKAASLSAANSALAHVEHKILLINTPPEPEDTKACYQFEDNVAKKQPCNSDLTITYRAKQNPTSTWMDSDTWQNWVKNSQAQTFNPENGPKVIYRVTFNQTPAKGGSKDANGTNDSSNVYYYRITARSERPGSETAVVTQSVYRVRY